MTRARRILVVEDDKKWRDVLQEELASKGFKVEAVSTREDAADRLGKGLVHLLVLDLRLQDQDLANEEGMHILRQLSSECLGQALRVLVLTGYGTNAQMRESFRQHGVEDFRRKQDFDADDFLAEVERVFRDAMRINFDLEIHWANKITADLAVVNLRLGGERIQRDTQFQSLIAEELDDLLCRLFHEAESLIVEPLASGTTGGTVLLARPFYANGGARSVVVKFGDVQEIEQEQRNFDRFIQPYVGGGRSTAILTRRRTQRLGGLAYSLVGAAGGPLSSFGDFYRRNSPELICRALDRLFDDTCGAWYDNPGKEHPVDLARQYTEWLGLTPEALTRSLERLSSVHGKDKLYFQSLSGQRPFTSPVFFLDGRPVVQPTYETLTHGDFNESNILLDEQGASWLIDFQRTGQGHALRDAIQLDTILRLKLLEEPEADLDERLKLEEALGAAETFVDCASLATGSLPLENPATAKVFSVCAHLRSVAGRLVPRHSRARDMDEYYAGLLFCALNSTRFFRLPTVQREHALLSASLLASRLGS